MIATVAAAITMRFMMIPPFSLLRCSILEIQLSSIRKNNFCPRISGSDIRDRLSIFRGTENDCHFIAGLERTSCPAGPGEDTRTVGLDTPVHNAAVLVFHVEI